MRYTLDNNGYIKTVAWGCMTGNCAEYTGEVPAGYASLPDWADRACINAYYLDENGNLVLDAQKMNYLQAMYEQQAIDYAPVLHRDLYATNEIIEAQYKKETVSGTIITVTNARSVSPMVKITGLNGNSLSVFAQTKNMLRNDAISLEVNGLTFTRDGSGIKISGTATADVEYTISGGEAEPLFGLLQGHNYCLNVGGYNCELLYFDGETTEQVYTGIGGVINLSESKRVSEVKLKFASGQTVNDTIYPTLAYGTATIAYEECQTKVYSMELPEYEAGASIIIGEGLAVLYSGGKTYVVGRSNMSLLNGYNMIYTSQGNSLEVTYTTNQFQIDDLDFLRGTSTTSNRFIINDDGSISATGGTFSGDVVMTGGSVSIQASSSSDNRIKLSYGTNECLLAPAGLRVGNETTGVGIVGGYVQATNGMMVGNTMVSLEGHNHDGKYYGGSYLPFSSSSWTYKIYGVHYNTSSSTTSNATCGYSSADCLLPLSSSSERYKHNIHEMSGELIEKIRGLYDVKVKNWTYNDGYLEEGDELVGVETFGLIAEDVAEVLPEAVYYKDGLVENYRDRHLLNAMLVLLQDQKKEIDSLKASIEEIKNGGAV